MKNRADETMKGKIDLANFEMKPTNMFEFENENFMEKRRQMQKDAISQNVVAMMND